jgi:hypothetical protein
VDGAVAGTNTVGGLAGVAVRQLTVTDVSVAGTVSGTGTRVGGLVGYAMGNENSAATFEKVAVDGTVYGSGNLGGLLGAGSGTVNISQAAVRVTIGEPNSTSASNIGGLIGTLSAASASLRIDNSIVTGTISGQSYLGGLVGALNGAQGSNISATISSVVTAVELSAQTEAVAGLINTLSDSNVDLTSVLNLARVVSSATTDGINQSAALVYGTVSLTNVTADKAYHWLGLSASAATYHPFAFGTVSDTPWKFNGDAVNCSNFSDQSFWTNTESMNLSADVWDFSAITNGYLPALKVLNVPLANQSFSCLNQITYQPDWGSAPTVQTKFGDSTTIPIADNTASIAHYFLANSDSSTAIYRFNAGDEQPFDIFYGSSVARCQLSNDQDWPLPEGGLFLDATISLRTSFCFKADFDFELLQSDGSLWLSWTATHVQSISIHFTTLTNLAGGTPPGISASQFTYQGAASAGSWSLGPPSAGTYIISVSGTMLGIGESQPQIISQSLTWTDYLQPVTPESSVSFPDVFIDGHAKTITYKYNGKVTVSRVAAVTASQYEAIRWLASMAVTVGSQSINGNVATYRPQDLVNRGAMAQFVQKLAGFTDAQIAARFQGHTTTFTDMGSLLKSNPARYYAILWLADTGITVGCNAAGTKFCPANPVNRGSMAELMRKFVGVAATSASTSPFPDVNLTARTLKYDGSSKAVKVAAVNAARMGAINWISGTGITPDSGTFGGVPTYRPQDAINRGAMAEFMHRLAQKVGSTS